MLLRLTSPNEPSAGSANAQVLKNVPGTHGVAVRVSDQVGTLLSV